MDNHVLFECLPVKHTAMETSFAQSVEVEGGTSCWIEEQTLTTHNEGIDIMHSASKLMVR